MKYLIAILLLIVSVAVTAVVQFTVGTPTEREDGTALGLSEIAGFTVYCGPSIGNYTEAIHVSDEASLPETVFQIADLAIGTHYCVVTTVDIDGRESAYSENHVTVIHEGIYAPKPPTIAPGQVIRLQTTIPAGG